MPQPCQLSTRNRIRAFRAHQNLLLVAEGELPTPGYRVDIVLDPRDIFPPQFDLLRCQLSGGFPRVVTPFRYAETVRFPADQPRVTVHHADGADEVEIEDCGETLSPYVEAVTGLDRRCPEGADQAVGFSKKLSFDEAFADALSKLPPLALQVPTSWPGSRLLRLVRCSAASPASTTSLSASAEPTTDGPAQGSGFGR